MEVDAVMSVRVHQLTKRFAEKGSPAVDDVSFEAPTGRITALIGPSGAGKSTILRLIAGLEIADVGRTFINEHDVTALPVQAREVGFVFQNYALFQHMTVHENIAFGLDIRKRPRDEIRDRVRELLHLVQLEEFGARYPAQLSGGQRQRVAFARALAIRPKVLLLDEPFGALDARVRAELREWLDRLHQETQLTTILITHDQQEAFEVSQHVVLMLDGRVVQAGSPREVYDHPATPKAAAFLGASLLRGHVHQGRAEIGQVSVGVPSSAKDGQRVEAFVHAHDVKLAKSGEAQPHQVQARIVRQKFIGGHVKVTVEMPGGDLITIDMARPDFESLDVKMGDAVQLDIRSANVFVADYQI